MVKIKICGLTREEDYKEALKLGVDFTGFIFYEKSPRHVNRDTAALIIANNPQKNSQRVGVFVNEKIETIHEIYRDTNLDIIQLHGDESPQYCQDLGLPYWKVIRVKDEHSLDLIEKYDCEVVLLDTFSEDLYGGTGIAFSRKVAGKAIETGKKIVMSGGVSSTNIDGILELLPYAVDINSSIEDRPGEKNLKKMEEIVAKIKHKRLFHERR